MRDAVRSALLVLILYGGLSGVFTSSIRQTGAASSTDAHADWPFWGGDAGYSRFSTLAQITPENVNN
jgi:glucose dehydrogenase